MTDPITVLDAAHRLGMDAGSVRRLLTSGALVGQKFGRDWQVSAASVAAYRPRTAKGRPRKAPPRTSQEVHHDHQHN